MNIIIRSSIVDLKYLKDTNNPRVGKCYSIMEGNSPYFEDVDKLIDWFKELKPIEKVKYITMLENEKVMIIYSHYVAKKVFDTRENMENCGSYITKVGEILSTDESHCYSFTKRKWD